LDDSKTNSYYAYLKLFNLIAEYQLELKTTAYRLVLKNIEAEYLELVKLTGFKRFYAEVFKEIFLETYDLPSSLCSFICYK